MFLWFGQDGNDLLLPVRGVRQRDLYRFYRSCLRIDDTKRAGYKSETVFLRIAQRAITGCQHLHLDKTFRRVNDIDIVEDKRNGEVGHVEFETLHRELAAVAVIDSKTYGDVADFTRFRIH